MPRNTNYEKWMALGPEEKKKISWAWNIYEGEGAQIAKEAARRLKLELRGKVKEVTVGWYHGDLYSLDVVVKKNVRIKLPDMFEGFIVNRRRG